jgi:RNA polymerase sigma-70 factor (ECF subfamily)
MAQDAAPGRSAPADADRLVARLLDGRQRFLDYVRRRVDDPELAADVVQDSLLRAVQAAPGLRDDARLIPWFYRVLQNAVVDAYRRRAAERERLTGLGERDADALPAAPVLGESAAALCACFRPLLATLQPAYAGLIDALDLRGEPPATAAARLGITPNTLKVRHHRARRALRRRLEETCRVCAEHHCLDCSCRAA